MTDATTSDVGNRFDLSLADIGPLFLGLRVSWNAMSPLAVTLDAFMRTASTVDSVGHYFKAFMPFFTSFTAKITSCFFEPSSDPV